MKKIIFLIIATLVLATLTSNAKVWRVNNRPNMAPDFTTLQAAIDGTASGDTLYIEPSPTSYGNGTFTKKLTVIGAGYWHSENDTTQFYREESEVAILTFNSGSQGSKISGLYVYGGNFQINNWKLITINTDSITIQRNKIYGLTSGSDAYNGNSIIINGSLKGIIIQQNWIDTSINVGFSGRTIIGIFLNGVPTNTIIRNNFIRSTRSNTSLGYYSIYYPTINPISNLIISNNVIWGSIYTFYTMHINNIMLDGTYNNGEGDQTSNNICNSTQYPLTGTFHHNNQQNVVMSTVFVNAVKYIDNGYFLKEGSPANGAAMNGGDCGVFSDDTGGNPYVLSGMPAIPSIFDVYFDPIGVTTIPVSIKAKSNN